MVMHTVQRQHAIAGTVILPRERLDAEGASLAERCRAVGGETIGMLGGAAVPVLQNGRLIGPVQMGSLPNRTAEKVNRFRDVVLARESWKGKPAGIAAILVAI